MSAGFAGSIPSETLEPERERWIRKTPGVCGGEACIRDTRITVWGLVAWRKLGLSDEQVREHVPDATLQDLQAAWAYYEQNRDEIERVLAENESA
jgi:uncharacterized protein (DUF433 family)